MIKVFKPYGQIKREQALYSDIVEDIGVEKPEGPERDAEIKQKLKECDVLQADVFIKVNKELLEGADNVRAVLCTSIGVDYVNIPEVTELGIVVANNPDFCIEAVAEYAIGMMMAVIRCIPMGHMGVMANNWNIRKKTGGIEVQGANLGLLGFGRIGREVARMAKGLGMNVLAYDAYMTKEQIESYGVTCMTLDELYSRSDVISVHTPLTPETKGLVGAESISRMKDGVYIVNVSRGGIVSEAALADALKSGKVAGAALDVLETEPLEPGNPLGELKDYDLIITPHTAWFSFNAEDKADEHFKKQLIAISEGKQPPATLNDVVLKK